MPCPYKYYDGLLNGIAGFEGEPLMCKLVFQRCPEGYMETFEFKECLFYKKEKK